MKFSKEEAETNRFMEQKNTASLKGSESWLTKSYKCEIDIEFPESGDEQQTILTNIEEIVKNMTNSPFDLDFVRDLVQDDHDEEVAFMNFEQLASMDLRELPWSSVKFKALSLTKGSTILNFNLTFEKPPENLEDVNVYRLMELFIRTAIENITFIKKVTTTPTSPTENKTRSISFKMKAKYTTIDDELQGRQRRCQE